MSDKNFDVQIAALEAQILKLQEEKEALRVKTLPQYPKVVHVPVAPYVAEPRTTAVTVNSEAEEKAAVSGRHARLANETEAQYEARLRAEKAKK